MEKTFETSEGKVTLRSCMVDVDGTNLVEGTSIYFGKKHMKDVTEYIHIEEMTVEDCEGFIEYHLL